MSIINEYILGIKTKGAKKSQKAIGGVTNSLGAMAKKMGVVAGAYFGGQALISGIKSSVQAYGEQEKVEKKLAQALGSSTTALKNQASALQQTTKFGDEATLGQMSYLASIGMTEKQISDMIPVAMDLASATGMTLEGAVRNTAKTLSGMTGELGESVPALRELTAEQLKSGEGVKVLGEMFKGMANTEAQTFEGSIIQMKNALGDLGEVVGSGLAPALQSGADVIKSFAEKSGELLTGFLSIDWGETGSNIFNGLGNLMNAVLESLKAYWGLLPEIIKGAFSFAMDNVLPVLVDWGTKVIDYLKNIASFLFEPIVMAGQIMGAKISNFFIEAINKIKGVYNGIAEFIGMNPLEMTPTVSEEGLSMSNTRMGEFALEMANNQIETTTDLTDRLNEIWTNYSDSVIVKNQEVEDSGVKTNANISKSGEKTAKTVSDASKESTDIQIGGFGELNEAVKGSAKASKRLAQGQALINTFQSYTKAIAQGGVAGLVTGASLVASGLAQVAKIEATPLAEGVSGIVSKPPLFLTGEDGAENVSVTNLEKPDGGANAGGGGITLNISAPLVDESVIDHIIPAIERANKMSLA